MKLTVLTWLKEFLINFIGKAIEVLFRIILCMLPLGVYLLVVQSRRKASSVSNLSVFTTTTSVWQHVFPGFILIAIDPKVLEKEVLKVKGNIDRWVNSNKYIIALLFMIFIVTYMILSGRN